MIVVQHRYPGKLFRSIDTTTTDSHLQSAYSAAVVTEMVNVIDSWRQQGSCEIVLVNLAKSPLGQSALRSISCLEHHLTKSMTIRILRTPSRGGGFASRRVESDLGGFGGALIATCNSHVDHARLCKVRYCWYYATSPILRSWAPVCLPGALADAGPEG